MLESKKGSVYMATDSIFRTIVLKDAKSIEAFVNAVVFKAFYCLFVYPLTAYDYGYCRGTSYT